MSDLPAWERGYSSFSFGLSMAIDRVNNFSSAAEGGGERDLTATQPRTAAQINNPPVVMIKMKKTASSFLESLSVASKAQIIHEISSSFLSKSANKAKKKKERSKG